MYGYALKPRRVMHSEIAALGGRAWASMMEKYNNNRKEFIVSDLGELITLGCNEVKNGRLEWEKYGREIPDHEQAYNAGVEARIEHALKKYMANDPLDGYRILDVELTLPDHGNARIDLGITDDSNVYVVDYKFKLRLDSKYYDKTIEEYRNDWQQYHYCWAYGEYLGEPIHNYMICLVVAEPKFSVKLHEFPIHPEGMTAWKQSAERMWAQMDLEDLGMAHPWMAPTHATKFGPCEYQRACFDHRWDMDLMINSGDYVVVKEDV